MTHEIPAAREGRHAVVVAVADEDIAQVVGAHGVGEFETAVLSPEATDSAHEFPVLVEDDQPVVARVGHDDVTLTRYRDVTGLMKRHPAPAQVPDEGASGVEHRHLAGVKIRHDDVAV